VTIPTAFVVTGLDGRKMTGDDRRLRKAQHRAQHRQQRERRHRIASGDARDHADAGDGKEGADEGRKSQTLLALQDGEQQGRQRDEREQRLPEAGVNADERVVGEAERATKDERAVEQNAHERAAARERQPNDGHHGTEKAGREQETQPGAPQRIELTVADPHADGVSAREHGPSDEGRERRAFPVELHEPTLRGAACRADFGSTRTR
jgi:hypothetical protein